MTPAKSRMCAQARNTFDDIWDQALETMPGAVCTKPQLLQACAKYSDDDTSKRVNAMVAARWRKMYDADRLRFGEKRLRIRAIRDVDLVRKACENSADRDNKWLCEQISLNGPL